MSQRPHIRRFQPYLIPSAPIRFFDEEAARRAAEAASNVQTTSLMPILVGKRTVPVATSEASRLAVRRSDTSIAASSEQPERAKPRGYFEKRSRATFWVELPK
ncbi:MAG: hypothetical protein H8F28_17775 [Fibrella sp.]|nr:hypothetical protein [Armatimonadota bacterium]